MKERGLYKKQLKKYYKYFKKEQILILDYKQIKENPKKLLKTCFNFLEVDEKFVPTNTQKNIKHDKDVRKNIVISEEDIQKVEDFYKN